MLDLHTYLLGFAAMLILALVTWIASVFKRDVSIVDSLWSILFLAATLVYVYHADVRSTRALVTLVLVAVWALRLSVYLTIRNWGQPEDFRYQKIRARNQPNFAFKSLYIVFVLQSVLAWIVSQTLLAAAVGPQPVGVLDFCGAAVVTFGILFEAVADWQLARFKRDPGNRDKVLDTGLWRYSRHPNYFGECCVWWGFYVLALGAGGWWSFIGPLLMTILLLKVSGVAMLERDIGKRRPDYELYIQQTNAFVPGRPRS